MLALGIGRVGGAGHQHDVVGAVGEGAPVFVAGDDPVVAVPPGPARNAAEIGADIGLGHGGGAEKLTASRAGEEDGALGLGHAAAGAQPIATGDDGGHAHPAARQFLGDQAVFEDAEAHAAIFFGDDDAEIAHVGQLLDELRRDVALLRIELVRDRQHFLHDEGARRLLDHAALVGHVTHGFSPFLA